MPTISLLQRPSIHMAVLVAAFFSAQGQPAYSYTLKTKPEVCHLGGASLEISGALSSDKVEIEWDNGLRNYTAISDLVAGEHWVRVNITSRQDTVEVVTDTTLAFTVEKERCPVGVPKHFSPNGDGYNDMLALSNIEKYPNFELQIFNKWGQQVHRQKNTYTPWEGVWSGITLPDGTYYYVLFYDASDRKQLQKGSITILR